MHKNTQVINCNYNNYFYINTFINKIYVYIKQETMEKINKGLKDPFASKYISMTTASLEKLVLELTFENEKISLKSNLLRKQYDNRMENLKILSFQEKKICEDQNKLKAK